ncbi:MAG: UDP-N-acetylglucosamine 4,6-dehydratase (inverting), partial [Pseudomonadota bacterium]
DEHFKILPSINDWATSPERIKNGQPVPEDFVYSSESNADWMTQDTLRTWIAANAAKIGKI